MSAKRSSPLRLAVLASGHGSNLQAIIDAIEAGQLQAQIVAVISNKKDAVALVREKLEDGRGSADAPASMVCRTSSLIPNRSRDFPTAVRPMIVPCWKCWNSARWNWCCWRAT